MSDYEQMEMDFTLQRDRDLKGNVGICVDFDHHEIMADMPAAVRNRHEGYGIAAEHFAKLQACMKMANGDMQTYLRLIPNGESGCIQTAGTLYNSALEVAAAAIRLASQAKRIISDLYGTTPLEEYTAGTDEEGFEELEEIEDGEPAEDIQDDEEEQEEAHNGKE